MNVNEFAILVHLDRYGPSTAGEIASGPTYPRQSTRQGVAAKLVAMRRRGLVIHDNPSDGAGRIWALGPKAGKVLDA